MVQGLYSVEQVAERLGLHVRTVRNYIRDGRLKAVRIGKQYRIAPEDVAALMGQPAVSLMPDGVARRRHVELSGILQVDAISPESATRLTTYLMAAARARPEPEQRLRIDTIYEPERGSLKVILLGEPRACAALLDLTAGVLEAEG
jgi:excisionase family DNA binding protein